MRMIGHVQNLTALSISFSVAISTHRRA